MNPDDRPIYEPPLNVTRWPRMHDHFYVRSGDRRKKDVRYTVILGDPDFPLGWCSCPDFEYREEPALRRGIRPEKATCKHCCKVQAIIQAFALVCEANGEDPAYAPIRVPDVHEYKRSNPHIGKYRGYR